MTVKHFIHLDNFLFLPLSSFWFHPVNIPNTLFFIFYRFLSTLNRKNEKFVKFFPIFSNILSRSRHNKCEINWKRYLVLYLISALFLVFVQIKLPMKIMEKICGCEYECNGKCADDSWIISHEQTWRCCVYLRVTFALHRELFLYRWLEDLSSNRHENVMGTWVSCKKYSELLIFKFSFIQYWVYQFSQKPQGLEKMCCSHWK